MLKNYLTITWRTLQRHRAYVAINIGGLSLGIACAVLIFTVVSFHLSFDTFHHDKDRIYRVVTEFHDEGIDYSQGVPSPLGKAFRNDFLMAGKVARTITVKDALVSMGDKKFKEHSGIAYTEPDFFRIFNFPLLQGSPEALNTPDHALLTESLARKYFGSPDSAIGRTFRVNNHADFTVAGILKDFPSNTDRKCGIYLSYDNLKDFRPYMSGDSSWGSVFSGSECFVLLKPGATRAQGDQALVAIRKKYNQGRDVNTQIYRLQPLADIHFNGDFDGYLDKKYLWSLSLIGLFILLTACLNFINLATAQSLQRSREVGIRKVLGGIRSQLFWQFIIETAMITLIALILGYSLAYATLPLLNDLTQTQMTAALSPLLAATLLIAMTFAAGFYPGLVLSRFQPVLALKSKLSQRHIGGISLRRILVISQFAISQMLIIGTLVVAGQLHYTRTKDLGFNKDEIVMVPLPSPDKHRLSTLGPQLREIPGVKSVSFCYSTPASGSNSTTNLRFGSRAEDEHWEVNVKPADDNYLPTFRLTLVAGRNFFHSDNGKEFVVNETFVKKLGLKAPGDVIGQTLKVAGKAGPIVGVVKDFYNESLHSDIAPIAIWSDTAHCTEAAIKTTPAALDAIQKIWRATYPEYVYSYEFLDDRIARFYELDDMLLKLIEAFALIAVLIGCLGLYGLVSFMAARKTKEIGIRKVLGATIPNILWIFGWEFGRLVLISFCLAAPPAWWAMHQYLQDFKYRIPIGPGILGLALLASILIMAITVGYRSLRAALSNPVKSLRMD